jgi:hypothetical protein
LEFVPFVEIIIWMSTGQVMTPSRFKTYPVKKEVKLEVASTRGKRKITFDPFADLGNQA